MSDQELHYKKLLDTHPLGLCEEACLALLAPRYATCRACQEICPVRAIKVGEAALELAETCVNCGRCAAVCPMGALALPGFTVPEIAQSEMKATMPVQVDCWKVPRELASEDTVRVPCLGGLSAGRIADLVASAGPRPLVLLDRGWCGACSAGGGDKHPAVAMLETVRALLTQAGLEEAALPRIEMDQAPDKFMPVEIPSGLNQQQLSRRAFFGALLNKTVAAVDQIKPLTPEQKRKRGFEREPVRSRERERLLHGMALATQDRGKELPGALFWKMEVSTDCRNHLLCAKICPTGALDIYEEGNSSGLTFVSALCIGCSQCVTVCPTKAIQMLPNGNDVIPSDFVRITCFAEQDCDRCGARFSASDGEELCPQCDKRRLLAKSAFASLFGNNR